MGRGLQISILSPNVDWNSVRIGLQGCFSVYLYQYLLLGLVISNLLRGEHVVANGKTIDLVGSGPCRANEDLSFFS